VRLDVLTIFPEYLAPLDTAILGRAQAKGLLSVGVHDLRDWTHDVHRTVDDTPFGGGPGMVMLPGVWWAGLSSVLGLPETPPPPGETETSTLGAVEAGDREGAPGKDYSAPDAGGRPLLVVPTPAGTPFTQAMAADFAGREHLVFACGRYEGIDQRVVDAAAEHVDVAEVSIGDYVLIGGEVAVLAMAEAAVRLIPGVLGNKRSHEEDSFSDGLLEGPSYTRPEVWEGRRVPEVLTSGNHAKIERWRRDESLLRTARRRPELLDRVELDKADRAVLREAGFGEDSGPGFGTGPARLAD